MSFSLLEMPDGMVSLEFALDDLDILRSAVEAMEGELAIEWSGPLAEARLLGESFVYADDDDELCVIAMTTKGSGILRAILDRLVPR